MVATSSVGGVLAGMVLCLNYPADRGNTVSPFDVSEIIVSPSTGRFSR